MKRKLLSLLLALVLALSLRPAALAAEPEDAGFSGTFLRTSYSERNYLELRIEGGMLHVSGVLTVPGLTAVSVAADITELGQDGDGEYIATVDSDSALVPASEGKPFSAAVPLRASGTQYELISVDYEAAAVGHTGHSCCARAVYCFGIPIVCTAEGYRFPRLATLDNTLALEAAWLNPADYLDGEIPEAVGALSREIAGGETDDYEKVRLLYEWTAQNIAYDYDLLYADIEEQHEGCKPETVLENRRSICSGFANLLTALIRAQGIPALSCTCLSGERSLSQTHAYTEAFAGGRWVLMDATWDSVGIWEDGQLQPDKLTQTDFDTGETLRSPQSYYYFDITPEALSLGHMPLRRGAAALAVEVSVEEADSLSDLSYDFLSDSFFRYELSGSMQEFFSYLDEIGYQGDVFIRNGNAYSDPHDDGALLMADVFVERNVPLEERLFSVENRNSPADGTAPSAWALPECSQALRLELIPWTLQGSYQSPVSREDFCHAAVRCLMVFEGVSDVTALLARHGLAPQSGLFSDTDDPDVCAAYLLGIVNGVGDGLFQPERGIYRSEAAALLMRTAKVMGIVPDGEPGAFTDTEGLPAWAQEGVVFVSALISAEGRAVMGGTGEGQFSPRAGFTTEQTIITCLRLLRCA